MIRLERSIQHDRQIFYIFIQKKNCSRFHAQMHLRIFAYEREMPMIENFFVHLQFFFFSFISIFVWICGLKFINRFSLSHDSNNCKTTATTKWTNFHVKHLSLLLLISLIVRIFYVITKVKKENKNQRKKWQKVNTKKRNSMTLCMVRGKRRWIWSME